jgi:steroid 5-alpha reductase family enzyme
MEYTAAVTAVAMLALWLVSLARRDASIVDIYWGAGFAVIAVTAFAVSEGGHPARRILIVTLTCLWGLRLATYLFWRNRGAGEDPRYQAMRRYWGERFPWVSLVTVFALQGVLMWFVSLPVQVAQFSGSNPLGILDALGVALFAIGLTFESVGDFQLARFKADPQNRGKVLDRGLWAWTRHPNYFGDSLVWWGLFTIALATPAGVYTVLSPAVMTFFLVRISGVALLERSIDKRRPDYEAYRQSVSAFIPRPRKATGTRDPQTG